MFAWECDDLRVDYEFFFSVMTSLSNSLTCTPFSAHNCLTIGQEEALAVLNLKFFVCFECNFHLILLFEMAK